MHIDVWSDIACPFCYLGKTTLEKSIAKFDHADEVSVTYHSYVLAPDAPVEPEGDLYDYLANKFGSSRSEIIAMNDNLTARAAEDGLEWHMEKTVPSNTRSAHRLLHFALAQGKQQELAQRLFQAYFSDGLNIAQPEVLVQLATEVGLDRDSARGVVDSEEYSEAVDQDIQSAVAMGVTGVPFFVINNKYGISGAQPESLFDDALNQAWQEETPLQVINRDGSDEACVDGACAT